MNELTPPTAPSPSASSNSSSDSKILDFAEMPFVALMKLDLQTMPDEQLRNLVKANQTNLASPATRRGQQKRQSNVLEGKAPTKMAEKMADLGGDL